MAFPNDELAGPQTVGRLPTARASLTIRCARVKRALVARYVPRRLGDASIGDRLSYPGTAGLVSVTQRQGRRSIERVGARTDRTFGYAGPRANAIPASKRQRVGIDEP